MIADRVPTPARRLRRSGDVQSVYVVPELRDSRIGATLLEALAPLATGMTLPPPLTRGIMSSI
ncbi:hypothetical protein ACFY2Q_08870 [Micromonospora sp. NPDC000316]|uniref:hypothetical protein n=1 Tax=Micromonospora sp. NPDC000316 TaxID=3364216 RepID=UPI0036B624B9